MSKLEIVIFLVLLLLDIIFLVSAIIFDSLLLSVFAFIFCIKLSVDVRRFPMKVPKKYGKR